MWQDRISRKLNELVVTYRLHLEMNKVHLHLALYSAGYLNSSILILSSIHKIIKYLVTIY